ncbi:MAG: AraC family transcriptional regulator [Spirochaetales bacterium]|nr:AraC family transcriptional regulator [Spirochaetales bacterium]
MNARESIQETIGFIEEHIAERLDIGTLSEVAHLSPFYYQRLFRRLVGKPVMEYVMLRRLARAADTLATKRRRIIDVAFEFGFENHETFSRSFKRTYGLTPERYRNAPLLLSHFCKPDISMKYQLVDVGVPLVADGVVLEMRRETLPAPRFFAGRTIDVPVDGIYAPGVDRLAAVWEAFHACKSKLDISQDARELGVSYPGGDPSTFTYFAGAEVEGTPEGTPPDLPDEFQRWVLPEGDYTVCELEAETFHLLVSEALGKARDYLFDVWLPGREITCEPFMAEFYIGTTDESAGMELWVKTVAPQ